MTTPKLPEGTRICRSCKQPRYEAAFTSEKQLVCNYCVNDPAYLKARAVRIKKAGDAFRAIIDKQEIPTFGSAPKMNDMLVSFFQQWGGQESFVADVVAHGKALIDKKQIHQDTTRFLTGMLKLVNENNKRQDDRDIATMTDEQLKREQQMVLMEMILTANIDQAKLDMLYNVIDAFELPPEPNVIAEVQDVGP